MIDPVCTILLCNAFALLCACIVTVMPDSLIAKILVILDVVCAAIAIYTLIEIISCSYKPPQEINTYNSTYILKK